MFRNRKTGAILTDEEYRALREREALESWNELTENEKEEWGSFEEFRQKDFAIYPDEDFVEYEENEKTVVEELLKLGMDVLVNYMDDELREQVHRELAPCTDAEFLTRYIKLHRERFNEEFDVN